MSKHILFGIALVLLLLSGCTSSPNVQLVELSKNTVVYDEIVRINNCGGKGDSEQIKSRDFATHVEFGAGASAGYQSIVQGSLSAKYSEYRNTSVSQRLVAPPGTDMEFVLRWSDDVRAGNVQVNGKSGTYEVHIPVSVEQVSSRDLGCGVTQSTPVIPQAPPTSSQYSSSGIAPCKAVELGPWTPIAGKGRDVTIESGESFVHADLWRPGGPQIKPGYDDVSVIIEPGIKVTIPNVAGQAWKYIPGCSREYVESQVARYNQEKQQGGWTIMTISFDEFCRLAGCRK